MDAVESSRCPNRAFASGLERGEAGTRVRRNFFRMIACGCWTAGLFILPLSSVARVLAAWGLGTHDNSRDEGDGDGLRCGASDS